MPILAFEAEIRDQQSHTSDTMSGDPDVTVNVDDITDYSFEEYDAIRVYIDDTHDASYDVTVRHTAHDDDAYNAEIDHTTYTVASGQDQTSFVMDAPIGQIRIHTATGALAAAPTTGRIRATFYLRH